MKAVGFVNKLFNPNAGAKVTAQDMMGEYIKSLKGLNDEAQKNKLAEYFLENE